MNHDLHINVTRDITGTMETLQLVALGLEWLKDIKPKLQVHILFSSQPKLLKITVLMRGFF